jgi:hypothetical protein
LVIAASLASPEGLTQGLGRGIQIWQGLPSGIPDFNYSFWQNPLPEEAGAEQQPKTRRKKEKKRRGCFESAFR